MHWYELTYSLPHYGPHNIYCEVLRCESIGIVSEARARELKHVFWNTCIEALGSKYSSIIAGENAAGPR